MDLLKCEYDPPTHWDDPELIRKLYGRQFDTEDTSGRGSIVVLGAHNSGTSITTRLIMLLGAFSGNYETLSIHGKNKLKYYEPLSVSLFHDSFLGKFVDTRFRPYHGQDLDYSSITDKDRANLDVRAFALRARLCVHASRRAVRAQRYRSLAGTWCAVCVRLGVAQGRVRRAVLCAEARRGHEPPPAVGHEGPAHGAGHAAVAQAHPRARLRHRAQGPHQELHESRLQRQKEQPGRCAALPRS